MKIEDLVGEYTLQRLLNCRTLHRIEYLWCAAQDEPRHTCLVMQELAARTKGEFAEAGKRVECGVTLECYCN